MTKHENLFKEHEYLAIHYANKVFNLNLIGLDKEDIKQEFRIKLYEIILAYDRSVETRKRRGMIRPVPFPFYVKGALNNFVKDYIKEIKNTEDVFIRSSDTSYDYAVFSEDTSEIDTSKNIYKINGFDLLFPLVGLEKSAFVMFLKGTPPADLQKIYGKHFNVHNLLSSHKKYLRQNLPEFELSNTTEIYSTSYAEAV